MENVQDQITVITTDALKFLSSLEHTFTHGLAQEKLAAIRQCTIKTRINAKWQQTEITLRIVPLADLQVTDVVNAKML